MLKKGTFSSASVKPGERVKTSIGSFEYITRDGYFARCMECGCPAYAYGGFYNSHEHMHGHNCYIRCMEAATPGAVLTYEDMRAGLETIRSKAAIFRRRRDEDGFSVLNADMAYHLELAEFFDLAYKVFYTSSLWGQSWVVKPVVTLSDYIYLLWGTPRFRAWVSSFLPIEVYVHLCRVYWSNRGIRCRFCFSDIPFLFTKSVSQLFVEDAVTPVVSLKKVEENRVLSITSKPSIPDDVDDPNEIFSDAALWPMNSGLFQFDPMCVPSSYAFNTEKLRDVMTNGEAVSVSFSAMLGSKVRKRPKDLSYLDTFFFDTTGG